MDFDEIYRQYGPVLRRVARKLCGSEQDADDLLQETILQAIRCAHQFRIGTNIRAWLIRIMHSRFIDTCRARNRAPRQVPIEDVPLEQPVPEPPPLWASITTDQVKEAVSDLEPEFRDVYTLFTFENASYQEIADRCGIPKSTVGTRLNRARRKLRERLICAPAD